MPHSESVSPAYRVLYFLVSRVFGPLLTRRHFAGGEHVPAEGGVLVVANHISNYDVLTLGEFLIASGRWPRFLGKAEIWKVPGLGWLARQAKQIPVERHTTRAKDSLRHARTALEEGGLVGIYPEGTITKDPAGWPMLARQGAARLALTTGVPVIPVGQRGAEHVLGGHELEFRRLFSLRRRDVYVTAGPPVDLSDLPVSEDPAPEHVEIATDRILAAVTGLYAQLRGEPAPELVWNPWDGAYVTRRPAGHRPG